jgi:RNA polymerase sigma-70 factor (ECF subfamily)
MLGPAHGETAEDLHQETWISVSRSAGAFDPRKASFRTWLFTIARRKVWDHFRRQRVTVLAAAPVDTAVEIADDGPTPLAQVESRELAERVVAAVEALPLAQRDVFVLFAHAGLSLEEISEITGAGMETTKSRLRYARATLRVTLAAERSTHV